MTHINLVIEHHRPETSTGLAHQTWCRGRGVFEPRSQRSMAALHASPLNVAVATSYTGGDTRREEACRATRHGGVNRNLLHERDRHLQWQMLNESLESSEGSFIMKSALEDCSQVAAVTWKPPRKLRRINHDNHTLCQHQRSYSRLRSTTARKTQPPGGRRVKIIFDVIFNSFNLTE